MALSTNYQWAEPDNSSLVKNGASDIRTLGNAIDVSLWNSGFGQAGKNKIINGDFSINQRAFTSTTTGETIGFDRFGITLVGDGTTTYSAQTFTTGTAPVAGYESKNFARLVTTGQTTATVVSNFRQRIESVRTFANQTVTISFWAKAATGTPKIAAELQQVFGGGGGSANVNTYAGQATLSTSWARYSLTIAVPSISGKTIGTVGDDFVALQLWVSAGSNFNARTGSLGIQTNTFDIWGVQAEYGSYATPFQTAGGGDPQSELAMCQRYYYQFATGSNQFIGNPVYYATTSLWAPVSFPVTMRTAPALVAASGTNYYRNDTAGTADYFNSFTIYKPSTTGAFIYNATEALGVAGYSGLAFTENASASIAFNSEL